MMDSNDGPSWNKHASVRLGGHTGCAATVQPVFRTFSAPLAHDRFAAEPKLRRRPAPAIIESAGIRSEEGVCVTGIAACVISSGSQGA
jgi:hypothetical protein